MTLLGQDVLIIARKRNKPLRTWLEEWAAIVVNVAWKSLSDVHKLYPSADGVALASGTVVTVFNAKGNTNRLVTWIDYELQVIKALAVIAPRGVRQEPLESENVVEQGGKPNCSRP